MADSSNKASSTPPPTTTPTTSTPAEQQQPARIMNPFIRTFNTLEEVKGDGTSCSTVRAELRHCLLQSDCVKSGRTGRDCLQSRDPSVDEQCHRLAYTFFECKRSTLDNRVRFRGRKGEHV